MFIEITKVNVGSSGVLEKPKNQGKTIINLDRIVEIGVNKNAKKDITYLVDTRDNFIYIAEDYADIKKLLKI